MRIGLISIVLVCLCCFGCAVTNKKNNVSIEKVVNHFTKVEYVYDTSGQTTALLEIVGCNDPRRPCQYVLKNFREQVVLTITKRNFYPNSSDYTQITEYFDFVFIQKFLRAQVAVPTNNQTDELEFIKNITRRLFRNGPGGKYYDRTYTLINDSVKAFAKANPLVYEYPISEEN